MLYCFKVETSQGIIQHSFKTLEEAKKSYDDYISYSLGVNNSVYGMSRIYTIKGE